jgi:hypothetical protein
MITKNNFFDRERLIILSEKSLYSLFVVWLYRKWLKFFTKKKVKVKVKIKKEIKALERISNCYSKIGYKTRFLAFIKPKKGFKTIKIIEIIL